jgi:hypothetical protein
MFDNDKFFKSYNDLEAAPVTIPGVLLNIPLVSNALQGSIGIELEMEATNRLPNGGTLEDIRAPESKALWTVVADGSLRGHAAEYIVTTPVFPEELDYMVRSLFDSIQGFQSDLYNSNRCSTHVHINMSGRKINNITSIICLWNVFEEAVMKWSGEERVENHFCLSTKTSSATVDAWEQFLTDGRSIRDSARNLKYSSLNLLPLTDKGSLEFRCGPVPDEPSRPIAFALFAEALCRYAADRYTNPSLIANDLSEQGGVEIFKAITSSPALKTFREEVLGVNGDLHEFEQKALEGFRRVQQLSQGHPWEKWESLINKEHVPNPFQKQPKINLTTPGSRINPAPNPVDLRTIGLIDRTNEQLRVFDQIPGTTPLGRGYR